MYMRITRGRVDPARYDESIKIAQDIANAAKRQPGCQSYHGGGDRGTGKVVAVSLWDSEANARFPREALGEPLQRLLALGIQLEPPDIYEVTAQA